MRRTARLFRSKRSTLPLTFWNHWQRVQRSVWAIPAALLMLAVVAALAMPRIDVGLAPTLRRLDWMVMSAAGARTILSSIASATVTVAGVVFSITMVMLSIASSQFGTRVLRNRVRARGSQLAIGTLLGTGVYCLIVLGSVNSPEIGTGVPHLSIGVGIALAVVSMLVVVVFLQEVSKGIQAPRILASLANDLDESIERLFPEKIGEGELFRPDDEDKDWRPDERPFLAVALHEGYVQAIDGEALMQLAMERNLLIYLKRRPGDFLSHGNPLAEIWGGRMHDSPDDAEQIVGAINQSLIVGDIRTPHQDVNCAVHELAQVAVRALSPGINDPFTAMNSIDRLSAALARLAGRRCPARVRRDDDGALRIVADPVTFAEALAAAFNQIRHYGRNSMAVCVRLLEGLRAIAVHVRSDVDRRALLYQARMLMEAAEESQHASGDLEMIRKEFEELSDKLGGTESGAPPSPALPRRDEGNRESERDDPELAAKGEVNG